MDVVTKGMYSVIDGLYHVSRYDRLMWVYSGRDVWLLVAGQNLEGLRTDEIDVVGLELFAQLYKEHEELDAVGLRCKKIAEYESRLRDTGIWKRFYGHTKRDAVLSALVVCLAGIELGKPQNSSMYCMGLESLIELGLWHGEYKHQVWSYIELIEKYSKELVEIARLVRELEFRTELEVKKCATVSAEVGLTDDVYLVLPSELLLLSDTELEYLFLERYATGKLLGIRTKQTTGQDDRIICVLADISGSMHLYLPLALSVAYTLGKVAEREGKTCYVGTFSDDLELFVYWKEMLDILQWQGVRVGGTNLSRSLKMLQERYGIDRMDLVVVTDGHIEDVERYKEVWRRVERVFAIMPSGAGSTTQLRKTGCELHIAYFDDEDWKEVRDVLEKVRQS